MGILYLEDRNDRMSEVEEYLTSAGYALQTCKTIVSAIQALEKGSFELVISGVHLESENAFDLVRSIREHPKFANLPIILLESNQSEFAESVNDALRISCQILGVNHYLAMSESDSKHLCQVLRKTIEAEKIMPP